MPTTGVEPARPKEHYPLKVARLPIPPRGPLGLKLNKKVKPFDLTFCDLTGARTQDPLLKREMLYQLSYQVGLLPICLAGANISPLIYFTR